MPQENEYTIDNELMDRLRAMYPDRLPTEQVSSAEVARLQGQQDVIRWLTEQKAHQESTEPPYYKGM